MLERIRVLKERLQQRFDPAEAEELRALEAAEAPAEPVAEAKDEPEQAGITSRVFGRRRHADTSDPDA